MARPTLKIKPESEQRLKIGKRLKILLSEQEKTQIELSDMIHLSQQTISKIINGKANLTQDRAEDIISLFPKYNLSWLLGFSDIKYREEADKHHHAYMEALEVQRMNKELSFFYHVSALAEYVGFNSAFDDYSLTIEPSKELSDCYEVVTLENDILEELKDDVVAFFKYRMAKAVKTGR